MDPLNNTVLKVGQRLFHVDRSALAAHSRYFEVLFNGGFKESAQRRIILRGVAEGSFKTLLDFTKEGTMDLNKGNITDLLEVADFLDLQRAKSLCVGFLERELRVSNCLGMMTYSQQYDCPKLYKSALNVALTHFSDLVHHEEYEFDELTKETLMELLQMDDLFVPKEDLVFEAVMKWVMVDSSREKDFEELVALVRPTFLSLSFLDVLVKHIQHPGGQDTYSRMVQTLDTRPPQTWRTMDKLTPTSRTYETLYVLGGKHEQEQQELFVYLPKTFTWRACSPLQRKNLTQYAVATVGNLVIVTGGYFRGDFVWYSVDWVLIYDSLQDSWSDGPPMKMSRNCHCSVGVGLRLYALGGSTDEGVIADVENMDLASLQWESRSPLVRPVERAAAASMGTKLYVVCGRDENGDVYSGVQRLNTETDQWDVISYSPMARYDLCATVLNGAIYTIGGQVFRFDLDTEEWSALDEDCVNRKFFMGCGTANGRIYLLGQRRASVIQDVPNFVLFDPYTDTCQVEDASLPCPLPIRGCVAMRRDNVWS
ncbi:kelch-like protein 23 [Ascaphus truei]|uniref:kelch-like protein 23 n=1 Tax=Ascaphus truei TaxID=8439 RepID=UPI003F5A3D67